MVVALGHVRAVAGRAALSVDVHLWVRELTRIDRAAAATARFRWGDDGPPVAEATRNRAAAVFPAIFCRHCGRSGWGVGLAPVGNSLAVDDDASAATTPPGGPVPGRCCTRPPRRTRDCRGRAVDGLVWFSSAHRELLASPAEDDPDLRDGWVLPVLTNVGPDADDQPKDTCPSCGQETASGSSAARSPPCCRSRCRRSSARPTLDAREKKALVFTDSVQDAAHRAGFVQARSHTLTLRSVLRDAVADGDSTLDALVEDVIAQAGDDPLRATASCHRTAPTGTPSSSSGRRRPRRAAPAQVLAVRKRLALDAALEFGLNSRTGRTLELTGTVAAEVDAGRPQDGGVARTALKASAGRTGSTAHRRAATQTLAQWVRGVLDRMRAQGAIHHPWFDRYRAEDGSRWSIWGGRPRGEGMPAFPGTGPHRRTRRSVGRPERRPRRPRLGRRHLAAVLVRPLDLSGARRLPSRRRTARAAAAGPARPRRRALGHDQRSRCHRVRDPGLRRRRRPHRLTPCPPVGICWSATRAGPPPRDPPRSSSSRARRACTCAAAALVAQTRPTTSIAACTLPGHAPGRGPRTHQPADRRDAPDLRGRLQAGATPQAPNVLVATPTLEMGIDIGDLSAVFLASLPRTVASYLQRVGRAGRLTGNALDLAFVTGRGEHLPKLGDPLSVIDGEVRPPATYLPPRRSCGASTPHTWSTSSPATPVLTRGRRPRRSVRRAGHFLGDLAGYAERAPV